jgi:hypothetical protein
MDDGQILCSPVVVDLFLRFLDDELLSIGITRGSGKDVKSCTWIVGSEAAVARHPTNWCIDYVRQTCECPVPGLESGVLGIEFGLRESSTLQFLDLTRKVRELHEQQIGDWKVEFVVLRSCASACKITHLLRAAAKDIDGSALRDFDAAIRAALERIVGVPLHAEAYPQSSLGVRVGGLGLR